MKNVTVFVSLFLSTVFLTAMMSSNAQEATPFPPEATVVPDGAVFTAPGRCTVSPDGALVALDNYAVFSLPDGEKLYDINDKYPNNTFNGRYLVSDGKVYVAQTGEVLLTFEGYGHWGDLSLHPDLFFTDYMVFDFSSGTAQPYLSEENALYIQPLYNGDFLTSYALTETTNTDEVFFRAYDGDTLVLIFDTQAFGVPMMYPVFSSDYTRVAIPNVGVFTYPAMEQLYTLPTETSIAIFGADNSLVVVWNNDFDDQTRTYHVIDAQTGTILREFTLNEYALFRVSGLNLLSYDGTKIALPIVDETAISYADTLVGWSLIDLQSGEVIETLTEFVDNTDKLNPIDRILRPYTGDDEPYVVNGRYHDGDSVINAQTQESIWSRPNTRITQLTTYYVVTRPCTVWTLP